MKNRTHIRAASPLSFLLPVAIFAALASLSFYPDSATYAQTETSETLEVPELTARATGTNTVELSWTAVTGAVRYELLAWQDSVTGWQRLDDGSLTGASYTHGGLTAGTTYYYTIRALNAAGETSGWLLDYPYATALAAQGRATSTPTAAPTVATSDRGALSVLYQATGGANWTRNDNWLTDAPLSAWYGVTTDAGGRVTELRLPNIGLSGPLPALSALTSLMVLDLGHNQLSGPLPDLSALTNLTVLHLGSNRLNGSVPDLNALTNLKELSLGGNQLSGSIPDLSGLTSLTELFLSYNQLSGPVPDLTPLTNLTRLHLNHNQLSGSIPDLSGLTSLTVLDLNYNQLSGPIPDLSALTSLKILELNDNQLSGPVPDLSPLSNLAWLDLSVNRLSGPIPEMIAPANLEGMDLSANRLTGPIPDLSALSNLASLYLNHNQLTGPVPDLTTLTNLMWLDLSGNLLCLPENADLTNLNEAVNAHLQSLNLPPCPDP